MIQSLSPRHDIDHLQGILSIVPRGGWCIEAGAHRGIWTRHLVDHFDQVIAFEPNPDHFAALKLAAPRAYCHNAGLWCSMGLKPMAPGDHNDGQWHISGSGPFKAKLIPLDVIDWPRPIKFIKLDVEGAEFQAIMGARETIAEHKPYVMIEQNGLDQIHFGLPRDAAVRALEELGMREIQRWNKDRLFGW